MNSNEVKQTEQDVLNPSVFYPYLVIFFPSNTNFRHCSEGHICEETYRGIGAWYSQTCISFEYA